MTMPVDAPLIFLAAHGEAAGALQGAPVGDARDLRLQKLCEQAAHLKPNYDWASLRVSDPEQLSAALSDCQGRRCLVIPLLFSDGFFYASRLKPALQNARAAGARIDLAPPFGSWPQLASLTAAEIERAAPDAEGLVLVIAHGSARSSKSADAARRFCAQLSEATTRRVETAFLEEPPYPQDIYQTLGAPEVSIGLFFGAGLHGLEDFDAAIARAPAHPKRAFTIGALEGLGAMVVDYAQAWAGEASV